MKQKRLWLLVGAPGSGKSTWAKQQNGIWISRDAIRFSMLKEGDHYFDHEDDVFSAFCNEIRKALLNTDDKDVYADASHLNWASRRKVLHNIAPLDDIEVGVVVFKTPLNVCFERNDTRIGHANVPHSVIRRMYYSFTHPIGDPFHYAEIKEI